MSQMQTSQMQTPPSSRSAARPRSAPGLYDASVYLGLSLGVVGAVIFLAAVVWALVAMFG